MKFKLPYPLILLAVVFLGSMIGISFTSHTEAIVSDAQDYIALAGRLSESNNLIRDIFSPQQPRFIDPGYSVFLSFIMRLFPNGFLLPSQLGNYFLWGLSTMLIYTSLIKLIGGKKARKASLLMALSPVFMTFPAKLYSEPLATLGVSIIISSLTNVTRKSAILLFVGTVILLTTKSVFLLFIIGLLFLTAINKKYIHMSAISLALVLVSPILNSSISGGRSRYTLAVQTAKLNMNYIENLACIPYNLSFPLGKFLLPGHQNTCIIFQSDLNLPRYEKNPVKIANQKYYSPRSFTYTNAFKEILNQPFKYMLIIIVDTFNLVFVEGFYANVLLDMPFLLQLPMYIYGKVLSLYLWHGLLVAIFKVWKQSRLKVILLVSPVLYFIFIVSHFHIEPRYFYPLLPWLYLVSAMKDWKRYNLQTWPIKD